MIKQELNILQEQGYMDIKDKRELIKAALLDCEFSLRESHDIIYKLRHDHHKINAYCNNKVFCFYIEPSHSHALDRLARLKQRFKHLNSITFDIGGVTS